MSEERLVATSGNFSAYALAIPDVLLVRSRLFGDARGSFAETYSGRDFAALGINAAFVQDNHSISTSSGTIRGLHFQLNPMAQAKLVRVLSGAIVDVVVDLRKDSPAFGRHVKVEMNARDGGQLYVPAGFAHGFVTRMPGTSVTYKVTNYYSPEHDRGIHFGDPALGIDWGIDSERAILSDRDRKHPLFVPAGYGF